MLERPPGGATMRWPDLRGTLSSIWAPEEEKHKVIFEIRVQDLMSHETLRYLKGWSWTGGDCVWVVVGGTWGTFWLMEQEWCIWGVKEPRAPGHRTLLEWRPAYVSPDRHKTRRRCFSRSETQRLVWMTPPYTPPHSWLWHVGKRSRGRACVE